MILDSELCWNRNCWIQKIQFQEICVSRKFWPLLARYPTVWIQSQNLKISTMCFYKAKKGPKEISSFFLPNQSKSKNKWVVLTGKLHERTLSATAIVLFLHDHSRTGSMDKHQSCSSNCNMYIYLYIYISLCESQKVKLLLMASACCANDALSS